MDERKRWLPWMVIGASILLSLLVSCGIDGQFEEKIVAFMIAFSLFLGPYLVCDQHISKKTKLITMALFMTVGISFLFFVAKRPVGVVSYGLIWALLIFVTMFDFFSFPEKYAQKRRDQGKL